MERISFRHLLDADPAINPLSWRWITGPQTPGKAYLVRLSNPEKYAHADLLRDRRRSHRIAVTVMPSIQKERADTSKRPLASAATL